MGCFLFLPEAENYPETESKYQGFVNVYGPDDFNGIKRLVYNNISRLTLKELIALIRLSHYDHAFFRNILPRIKQVLKQITFVERRRLRQSMHEVWDMYFSINESFDLAYELGGISYDLGFYQDALAYFQDSVDLFGPKADVFFNQALCHYQLKEDDLFLEVKAKGEKIFPGFEGFKQLDDLDLSAD